MSAIQEVNQAPRAGTPQFQATPPVTGGTSGESALQVASVGAGLFQQAAAFQQKRDKAEAASVTSSALGGLQQKLLNIRMAGATDASINVTQQSRLALTEFNVNFPELREDASKAFKAETGVAPAGLSSGEQAEQGRRQKSLNEGYGRIGASDEFNEGQHELRLQLESQDAAASRELRQIELTKARSSVKKTKQKEIVMKHFQAMSQTLTEKTSNENQELVDLFKQDPNTQQESLLTLRKRKMEMNRIISSLGQFAEDPAVRAYATPILDDIQLTEDILLQKIDTKAASANKERNIAVASAMFASDPTRAGFIAQTQMLNGLTIPVSGINANVARFVTGGSVKAEFERLDAIGKRGKPAQTDITEHTEDDKKTTKSIVTASFKADALPEQKEQAAAALNAAVLHLDRNGEDYETEDIHYVLDLLSTPGAVEAMTPKQLETVSSAFVNHVTEVVDVSVRKNIIQAEITIPAAFFPNPMMGAAFSSEGGIGDTRPANEVADLITEGGLIYWKPKAKFMGNRAVRKQLNSLNKSIAEEVTPAATVSSKVTGTSFSEVANGLVLQRGVSNEAAKKPSGATGVGTTDAGKVVSSPESIKEVVGQRESSGDYTVVNQLGYLGKYQFGSMALQDLGYQDTKGSWTGKGGIDSKEEFLQSSEVQEKAADKWFPMLEKRLKSNGALGYVGQEFKGVIVSKEGLVAAAHLVGAAGVRKMLETGEVPQDANGTDAVEYLKLGGGE